jgi:large subunit ribosomal protein L15
MPLYRRVPKLKTFPLVNRTRYTIVNVKDLADLPANSQVSLASLLEAGILTASKEGRLKILADGELSVPLQVTADAFTAQARTKIEAAGGTCILTAETSSSVVSPEGEA